ncbi:TauD/TfdA family dioxygenase [Xenorhabdus nematophila]|uniref:Gamma-butyrobetaine dioxygenase n=1 Tax=Xenorhabdus nematophila (strain ATCC 19061 / DSM 3370 / CCUG 14189 / LMG 1036 / NCIMB 9965 / AN6) TaxID=406817 RepID=D3VJC2_XENNA|nr:TauD/TfdA family dioxygenase [Xenorhabdus nematophila]CEE90719.1 putative Gamma-butyrobetaine dioxygenase [Xenorhabdus nematophila str. Anatoliense]CBJ88678.1 putative Gamma-butyrobetaine dioxygenase [Xenorhabdus nematophila ATCC 19061]CCW31928.1 putative Gamma-butyrobetaine dioxygenase [Xenorhabdus nematophila F1]CEE95083.1 putative Gamma-butyrobetaine dioxygenase [Xenorhabdus nematophila str. Anatoliense]CEK21590.1 putative Gamma-butyrobetaine dioxygenase [Xenorhabdus nematophila AN6/1]
MLNKENKIFRLISEKSNNEIYSRCVIQIDNNKAKKIISELSNEEIDHDSFDSELKKLATDIYKRIKNGSGIVVLKGMPISDVNETELGERFLRFCCLMGKPVSQSVMGDILGRVEDMTHIDPDARGYRNKEELFMHTDQPDMVCMLCVRSARQGGHSKFASALALHEAIKQTRPDLLPALYTGYPYHRLNEHPPGANEITEHNVPVFSECNGDLSIRYLRFNIFATAFARNEKIPELLREAIDYMDELATSSTFCWITSLEKGDMLFFNNYLFLHSRTAFEDDEDPMKKRLMYRVWLECDNFRSIRPELAVHPEGTGGRGGITPQEGKRPRFDYDLK